MKIPGGGDLMPARRRHYGGGYGRRRHQRNVRLGVGVLLLAVGAGAAYLLQRDDHSAQQRVTQTHACPTASPVPSRAALTLPAANQVHLQVLNGTDRPGLAKTIADELAAQGFVITGQGNAPAALAGSAVVSFGTGAEAAGTLVSHWLPGARLNGDPKLPAGSVQVVLGSAFGAQIASPTEAALAGLPVTPSSSPAPTRCAA